MYGINRLTFSISFSPLDRLLPRPGTELPRSSLSRTEPRSDRGRLFLLGLAVF